MCWEVRARCSHGYNLSYHYVKSTHTLAVFFERERISRLNCGRCTACSCTLHTHCMEKDERSFVFLSSSFILTDRNINKHSRSVIFLSLTLIHSLIFLFAQLLSLLLLWRWQYQQLIFSREEIE